MFIACFPGAMFFGIGKTLSLMSFDMKVFKLLVNSEAVERLDIDETSIVIFNLLRRLSVVFGGRAVHDAVCHYLALSGYDVHKL